MPRLTVLRTIVLPLSTTPPATLATFQGRTRPRSRS